MKTPKKHFYLDYNASAPLHPDALSAMLGILKSDKAAHNASAVHFYGREGRKIIELARNNIARLINAPTNQVIFNSGATEGNNTVLRHFSERYSREQIITSSIEHPSIGEAHTYCHAVTMAKVDQNGLIILDELEAALESKKTSLVSCMHVNNETGVIQDIKAISALAHKHGALFHCDATQSAGRIQLDMQKLGIDFLTLSSHKIGGPQGVGILALGLCGQTPTLLFGGGQEKSARAGTENVAGIAGFGAAAHQALESLESYQNLSVLRDKLEHELSSISPEIIIHGKTAQRVANTSFFSLPGANAQSLLMALDLEGFAISNGSACSSGTVKASETLKAMGQPKEITSSALRISMGWATTEEDIESCIQAWAKIYSRIKK